MSASLVTFANFGRKQNLRTSDMLPIAETFAATGELEQIICQLNAGYSFPRTIPAIPRIVRYPIRAIEKIFKISFPRQFMDDIFDFFAARRLTFADVTFIHGGFFMPRLVRRAHALGSTPVDISVSAHIVANAALEREELALLGVTNYEGTYMQLARTMTPLDQIDHMILMSDFAERTYLAAGYPAERISIAYLDIDTKRFSPGTEEKGADVPFQILYMAFTQPLKGLHYLLDAWEAMDLPRAELVIVGDYSAMPEETKQQYRSRIERDPRITWFPGTQTPEEYYRQASVFVFPSLTEGFGRSTIEAMACGIPVITTTNARGIVEDGATGFVVPIRSSEVLKEKIEYLYAHPEERKRMGKNARAAVENKKPFGEAVHEIYQAILNKKKAT